MTILHLSAVRCCATLIIPKFRPLVISGPTGCGKSTLIRQLLEDYPDCFALSVSHTTRAIREGEVHGKDYFFVSRKEFELAIGRREFIEFAVFSGNLYGTSKNAVAQVASLGRICVLDLDVQGVKSMKQTTLNPKYVFIRPPGLEELKRRLLQRGTESVEVISKRLSTAATAMEYARKPGSYDVIIDNVDLDSAYKHLQKFVAEDVLMIRKAKKHSNEI